MSIGKMILPEFEQEMATTRKVLERIPFENGAWKPHEKSFSASELATHVCNIVTWLPTTLQTTSLDVAAPDGPKLFSPSLLTSKEECLDRFDQAVEAARKALQDVSDEAMREKWTLLKGGQQIFSIPRVACVRSFVLNHLIHHRGQLSVYLRLNDVPVPSIYGPTADEGT